MLARHRRRLALAALLHACARTHEPPTDDGSPLAGAAELAEPPAPAAPVAASMIALPSEVRSAPPAAADDDAAQIVITDDDGSTDVVRFVAHAEVRLEPRADAPVLGVVGFGERVRMVAEVDGEGCERPWVQVEPGGFVCAKHEPADGAPSRVMLPRIAAGGLVPGVYGKLREGQAQIFPTLDAAARGIGGTMPSAALTVRRIDVASAGGRSFWRTRHGYVAASEVRGLKGSRFRGVALGDDGLAQPLAWARFRGDDGRIAVRSAPSPRAKIVARMRAREHARVAETSLDGDFVRLAGLGWVARDEVRIAAATSPPQGMLGTNERWIDIDIDEQVLVAYEGARPVYATLVSTGRRTHDTPIGTFRIERKVAERTMSSKPGDDEPYSVDRVPWTAYFTGSFALHAAYWHGSFGERKSHGCVNLAPADARVLYRFTTPAIVPAWSEVHGSPAQPGSLVRVRDDRHPAPPLYGYALELANALPTRLAQSEDTAHAFANILGAG
ncbi:MAG TPA: L,D-transpeptidase family protein [Nannocystaceae bacterium]|nr:L,D-transpeptidase family protein [Nannocystaceae bacterium]